MALFHECTPQCAQKELDTADIVREAMFHQLSNTYCACVTNVPPVESIFVPPMFTNVSPETIVSPNGFTMPLPATDAKLLVEIFH